MKLSAKCGCKQNMLCCVILPPDNTFSIFACHVMGRSEHIFTCEGDDGVRHRKRTKKGRVWKHFNQRMQTSMGYDSCEGGVVAMRTRKPKHFIWVTPFTCIVAPQALVPSLPPSFCNGKQRMSVMFGGIDSRTVLAIQICTYMYIYGQGRGDYNVVVQERREL